MGGVQLLPDQASTVAGQVDTLFLALIVLSALFAIPVCLLIIYFAIKYRRGARVDRTPFVASTMKIELAWSLIPLALALGVFVWAHACTSRSRRHRLARWKSTWWAVSGCGSSSTPKASAS